MKIYIKGHSHTTPLLEIAHAMTDEKTYLTEDISEADVISIAEDGKITTTIKCGGEAHTISMDFYRSSYRTDAQNSMDNAKKCYYLLASKLYGRTLPWGHMTGIRPAKIANALP